MTRTIAVIVATVAALLLQPSLASAATWTSQDVGSVAAAGSSTNTTNADGTVSATVKGSGSDIWDVADEFQFDYQTMTGDGTITARVASLQHTDDWAKAGVMIRETLAAGSRHALAAVTAANGIAFQRRTTTNGVSTHTNGPSVAAPYWVRLTRSGNALSAYSSADGTTWTLVGQDTVSMAATVFVGLAVTSHLDGTLNTASFDHVVVNSTAPPPGGWTNQDVGSVGAAGTSTTTTNADGTFSATVKGSGSDIWDVADEFQFDFQTLAGDGTITARVASQTPTDQWAKSGVMIRETLAAGSVHAFAAVTVANGIAFQRRTTTGGVSAHTYGPTGVAAPYWVRLTRSGNTFSAYSSPDGTNWTLVGQATITMAASVYVGLAVTSHQDGTLNTASFDHVVVGGSATAPTVSLTVNPSSVQSGGTTQLTWTSTNATSCTASGGWSGSKATSGTQASSALTTTTTFTLTCTGPGGPGSDSKTVTVGVPPSGWTNQDVGSVGAAGSSTNTTNADGTVSATVKGSGSDIWDVADEFQFDYQTMSGDGTITARVASQTNTDPWAKSGVMIRETLGAGSTHALVAVTVANGIAFQRRTTTGGVSAHIYGPSGVVAPYWVRLNRSGNTFSSYTSADGTTWSFVGQATITMAASVYIGLAVTSHSDGVINTASFDHVTVSSAGTPTVSLTVNPATVQSGGTTQLTWTSTNATSCTASGGWSGAKAPSGTQTSSALIVTTTFTLMCTGPGGTGTDSKTVTVSAPPGAWSNQDIGSTGAAGSSTRTTNADGTVALTVNGSGADIYDTSDQFQFDYQSMAGDGTITARVATQTPTDPWAKAGVMIRETLGSTSTHAFVALTPANGVAFQRRTTTGGQTAHTYGPTSVAPYWLRLTRKGTVFSAYASADGTAWTLIGQSTISMAVNVYVGLAVTAHRSGTLGTATFDHVVSPSSTITGVRFNWSSYNGISNGVPQAIGSDNWGITWSDDDKQYAIWGDGGGFLGGNDPVPGGRSSMGVARITGESSAGYTGVNAYGGLNGECAPTLADGTSQTLDKKSHGAPLSIGGVIYAWLTPGSNTAGYEAFTLYKSVAKGANKVCDWQSVGVTFDRATYGISFGSFVQFGKDNGAAIDGYVYTIATAVRDTGTSLLNIVQKPGYVMLLRVPVASINNRAAYQFFQGLDTSGQPTWSSAVPIPSTTTAIYTDLSGVGPFPQMSYVPGLGRFVYTNQHGNGVDATGFQSLLTMEEAPHPWGPWTNFYRDGFSSDLAPSTPEKTLFQWNLAPKWYREGDSKFTLIFSGTGTNDSWNTVDGTFIVTP